MEVSIDCIGVWLRLVERHFREVEAASSSLVTPSVKSLKSIILYTFEVFLY